MRPTRYVRGGKLLLCWHILRGHPVMYRFNVQNGRAVALRGYAHYAEVLLDGEPLKLSDVRQL